LAGMKRQVDEEFMAFALLRFLLKTSHFEMLTMTILNSIPPNTTLNLSDVESRLMAQ
ncbi:hypothetical protein K439DRAFT_1263980, partial [Ramaria rubella]